MWSTFSFVTNQLNEPKKKKKRSKYISPLDGRLTLDVEWRLLSFTPDAKWFALCIEGVCSVLCSSREKSVSMGSRIKKKENLWYIFKRKTLFVIRF